MSLLPNNTFASPGNSIYGGPNAGLQTLSQTGNTVSLSPSGGSVDIAATTLVADTAQKTTALSYDIGFLATTVNGELLIKGRTEVGEPLNPANLSVTGTLEVGGAISDNSTATGSAGQFLSAGAGGEAVWATIPGGSGVAAVNAGTNISIPDPGVPVVSVAITSDLDMNGYNITTPSNLTIATDTGTVTISNPVIGVGGAQLNVNGSASIRGDTAQLQILDNAGVQKGSLSYNVIDGQTHLDATDIAVSSSSDIDVTANDGAIDIRTSGSGNIGLTAYEFINITAQNNDVGITGDNAVSITATRADLSLTATAGNVTITANESNINLDSHTDIGISCNNGGTITVGGADTGTINITTGSGSGNMTLSVPAGTFSATCDGDLSLVSGAGELGISAGVGTISISAPSGTASLTSGEDLTLSAGYDLIMTAGASASLTTTSGGIELHSNGANLVLASSGDGVTISSGGGDQVSITGGGGGINCSTTSGGNIGLTSDGNITMTAGSQLVANVTDNVTVTGGADVSISTTNPTGIAQIATANTFVSLDEATQSITLTAGSNINLTPAVGSQVVITGGDLNMSAQRIIGINNVQYEHSYSTTGVTLTANSTAIQTFNGTGLTATLLLVDATNVGRQFIITNVAIVGLTVSASGGQLIYYNVGSASATTRTLAPGHSQILTAIRTGVSTYGWSMV